MITENTQDEYPINIPISFNGYSLIQFIDCGSTSVVFLVENEETKKQYSAKIMAKEDIVSRKIEKSIFNEVEVLQSINHPGIIKIEDFFEYKNALNEEYYVIIMEYCPNGDLLTYANDKGFKSEGEKKKIISGFLDAIKYLHNHGISHGDIKSENILLDENFSPKLCDFGYCRRSITAGDESKNGTLYYGAPELFVQGPFDTLKSDIYAIGITLYSINELQFPFLDGNQGFIVKQIINSKFSFRNGIDKKLLKLVEKCTAKNPKSRPSVEEILCDEYLTYNNLDVQNKKDFKNSKSNNLHDELWFSD